MASRSVSSAGPLTTKIKEISCNRRPGSASQRHGQPPRTGASPGPTQTSDSMYFLRTASPPHRLTCCDASDLLTGPRGRPSRCESTKAPQTAASSAWVYRRHAPNARQKSVLPPCRHCCWTPLLPMILVLGAQKVKKPAQRRNTINAFNHLASSFRPVLLRFASPPRH